MNLAKKLFGESWRLADMHCHLDFASDPAAYARAALEADAAAFSNTVEPAGFLAARDALAGFPNVAVGVGLHPWWLADSRLGRDDVALACELVRASDFVGEVGLDFAPRREGTFELQTEAFRQVALACAGGGKVLSVHAVRAAGTVLDILEETHALKENACILHWFSGTQDELRRAVALGCHFSFGTKMLQTRRGRSYAALVPPERRLLETDLPQGPSSQNPAQAWLDDLVKADEALRLV